MKFHAYIPREDGTEPMGSLDRAIFELKTIKGAKARCKKWLGSNYKLFTYINFYDDKTFKGDKVICYFICCLCGSIIGGYISVFILIPSLNLTTIQTQIFGCSALTGWVLGAAVYMIFSFINKR